LNRSNVRVQKAAALGRSKGNLLHIVAPEEHTSADSHALNSSLPDELLEQSNANVEETSGCFFVDQDWCGRHTRARSHTNVAGT